MKDKILKLKKEKNAVILAHYYVPAEVREVADYIGDSYYLAKVAKKSDADIIMFCGVGFMGESAKLLNPDKKVLMPDVTADCPMAHMADIARIKKLRAELDDLAVVCYINSTAELKSVSDVCVTSSNAVKIVSALPNKNIFFIPDRNLGKFVADNVTDKNIILNDGCCPIHASLKAYEVIAEKEKHPNALVLAHPECEREVLELSDYIGSTADIINYSRKCEAKEFIICTESGVAFELASGNDKKFYFPRGEIVCPDMKLNTLEKIYFSLEAENNEINLPNGICELALKPLDRMLELAK